MSDQAKPKLGTCGACVWFVEYEDECRYHAAPSANDSEWCRHYLPRDRSERCCETCEWMDSCVGCLNIRALETLKDVVGNFVDEWPPYCSEWQLRRT